MLFFAFFLLTIQSAADLDAGIVRGALFDFAAHGEKIGHLCQEVLSGKNLEPGNLQPGQPNALLVNQQALRKWKISESLIRSIAIVSFRWPSLWQEHRRLVLGVILLGGIAAGLILVLLRGLARLRRTRSELNDRLRFERLIAMLSTKFVNVPPEKVDQEVEKGLDEVLNAFDAMHGTPLHLRRVVLSTTFLGPTSQATGAVCTIVRDFGTGLSEKVRQRIFEHFFSTKRDGLGMGLAIARSIVESFGGVLDATNAIDGGAIFHFTLTALH